MQKKLNIITLKIIKIKIIKETKKNITLNPRNE